MSPWPAWAETTVWWSLYPLGACGAPIRTPDTAGVHHRLARLENWLDYLLDLGCTGLQLGPLWASTSHGYDVEDHYAIDPRLGDQADFDHLVAACRARHIRLLLDGVFNHVSPRHPRVLAALAEGLDSPAGRLFRRDPGRPDGLSRFEGHDGLVEIDHSAPEALDYVSSVMEYWLARGADGWRLDAAYRVAPRFWAEAIARVKQTYPEMLTVAEVLHGDYGAIAAAAGFASVTQYELWKAIWSSLKDRNPHELAWTLARHQATHDRELAWTFVSNHDVSRIATQVEPPAAQVAAGLLLTLPGQPAIYYGDEQGWRAEKRECLGGDDAVRPELPEHPVGLDGQELAFFETYRRLTGLRRAHPWLATASVEVVHQGPGVLRYHLWSRRGDWLDGTLRLTDGGPQLTLTDRSGHLLTI